MTDDLDPLSNFRGLAAFSRTAPYRYFQDRLRRPHWEMAANVLGKARRVLATDPAKASAYVDTALRLPYDEIEEQEPAALEAHLMLYSLVSDVAEESEQGDPAWLDAAIEVMEASDPAGRAEMRVVLDVIGHDYKLPATELRTLRDAIARVEPGPTLHDDDFPADQLKERIMAVLELCQRYDDTLEEYYR
ncbi:MAG: hypothetical protein QM619_07895 [Micropruina sp.]|uniref:hypothetical protein n=1 Tax=Micropruina sp. TaxID=2737536 RepID=UPI0039E58FEB